MSSPPLERSCLVCRKKGKKQELLRLVWNGKLVVDRAYMLPGRGAYLHAEGCPRKLKPEQIRRVLKLDGELNLIELQKGIEQLLERN